MTVVGASACPVHQTFDPLDDAYLADPYPFQTAVRDETPAFYAPSIDMWVITRYDDVAAVFMDPQTFSAKSGQRPAFPLTEAAQGIMKAGFHAFPVMSDCDPPQHTRIRAHNVKSFSARRTAKLEPKIWAKTIELVDAIEPGRVDLVPALTYPLPAYVIFTLMGFPDEDMDMLKDWCVNRIAFTWGRPGPAEQEEIATNLVSYWTYCKEFVEKRLKNPADDFTSDLVRIHHADPDAISAAEIVNVTYGMSFAGHETTTASTGNAIRTLLSHRDQWVQICADRSLLTPAVEELLRYDSSVVAWRRITTRPVDVGGVQIPADARVLVLLGAANRDPDHFTAPETFDIHREDARKHISFGKGIHYCLGASLARMESRIVLDVLAQRAPGMTLVADQDFGFPANISFRGPHRLLVDWPG